MKVQKSILVEFLGDWPLVRILDFLIEMAPFEVSKEQIIRETGISRNSLFAHWKRLERFGIVKAKRKAGRATLYVLDGKNPVVRLLWLLEERLLEQSFAEFAGAPCTPRPHAVLSRA